MDQVKKAICQWCHSRCRVLVHSRDGKLVKIEEDRSDPRVDQILPATRGCARLLGAKEFVYHPDRLRFPLKRKGAKGENKWERISWDQALDEIAGKLGELKDRYGPETLMATSGTDRSNAWTEMRFMNAFGSPNYGGPGLICFGPVQSPAAAMTGWPLRHRTSFVIEKGATGPTTKCALMIGLDPSQAVLRLWKSMREAKEAGTKIIVVDPRRTRSAELADLWLQIRPGTDAALLLGMINMVISEGLYDREFVEKWCYGFEDVVKRVSEYTPEKVAGITWLPVEQIRQAARWYATLKPGVCVHGMGMEQLEDQQDAIQARIILQAITGNIDIRGGDYTPGSLPEMVSEGEMELPEALSPEQRRKQLGIDRFRLLSWPGREIIWHYSSRLWKQNPMVFCFAHFPTVLRAMVSGKPYPVRAGITVWSNPMITAANTRLVYQALKSLDLYVVKDSWMTPSALLADYVLPSECWLERPLAKANLDSDTRIVAGEQALPNFVPDEFEYLTDYEFFRGLGVRTGQEQYWPWRNLEEAFDYQLKPMGMTHREFMEKRNGLHFPPDTFKKYEKQGFSTPTGKLELRSTILERLDYDPLPKYVEPKESPVSRPDLAREYPLMLITGGRFLPYFHSEHRQIESVRKRYPHPVVQLHPDTARSLGIEDGDWIWIETIRGRCRMKCSHFEGIHPQVVHAEHGWWYPELPGEEPWLKGAWESNINVCTGDELERCDPKSGGWPLKTALCRVYKQIGY